MKNDKCKNCHWDYNGICACTGIKPCNCKEEKNMTEAEKEKGRLATEILDVFTKVWCINHWNHPADLEFECNNCPFADGNECRVKKFRNEKCPDFEDFGSMTR